MLRYGVKKALPFLTRVVVGRAIASEDEVPQLIVEDIQTVR